MEKNPHLLIEGMLLAAYAFGLGVVLVTQNPVDLELQGSIEYGYVVYRTFADRA